MKTTDYFKNEVLRKRPYIKIEWCEDARNNHIAKKIQDDGRIKYWSYIKEEDKFLRTVFLEDNDTLHNAFFDRNFKKKEEK